MGFGSQVSEQDAIQQMDAAFELGITLFDCAELYPFPFAADHCGRSEEIVGRWMQARRTRDRIVLASKVVGRMQHPFIKNNRRVPPGSGTECPVLDRANIMEALEASLRRLQTDHLDLYQLHWPDRYVPSYGSTVYDVSRERDAVPFETVVAVMGELMDAGKIRHWGVSNETSYGVCRLNEAAARTGVQPPVAIQNGFSLTCRHFEQQLAECCAPRNYDMGLLAYGPLAGGSLTGKYLQGRQPEGTRWTKYGFQPRYFSDVTHAAVAEYDAIAKAAGLTCTQLALAWCRSRWFVASVIIGASSVEQLEESVAAFEVELDAGTLAAIDGVHYRYSNPTQDIPGPGVASCAI